MIQKNETPHSVLDQFPKYLEECIDKGATRLGEALEILEWPNGGKDAPCHEVNALINISFYLSNLPKPFHVYAEATVDQRGRVDMIGYNGETSIALEAKSFGAINAKSDEVLNDLKRLKRFRPSLTELADNQMATQWWDKAQSRWAIIVISSFRGRPIRDAWLAQDEKVFREIMETYGKTGSPQTQDDGTPTGFLGLYRAVPFSLRRASLITDAVRWGTGEGWLLWAALAIPRSSQ